MYPNGPIGSVESNSKNLEQSEFSEQSKWVGEIIENSNKELIKDFYKISEKSEQKTPISTYEPLMSKENVWNSG